MHNTVKNLEFGNAFLICLFWGPGVVGGTSTNRSMCSLLFILKSRIRPQYISLHKQVWNLTLSMLGKKSRPFLSAKAAETHGLLEFVVILLDIYMDKLSKNPDTYIVAQLLKEAGLEALAFDSVLADNPRVMPRSEQQNLFTHYTRFLVLFERAGGNLTPKCHLMYHLIQRVDHSGNARFHMTYKDESLNGVIARIAKSCHRRHWEWNVHRKYNIMLTCGVTFDMH